MNNVNTQKAMFNHNVKLTPEQVENMKGCGIKCTTDHTEKQVLVLLRKKYKKYTS